MELEWVDPPQEAFVITPGGLYGDMAKELRKNPGKWAVVPRTFASADSAKNTAMRIRSGRMAAFLPKGTFEGVSHETTVWVRFVDEETDEETPARPRLVPTRADTSSPAGKIRVWAKDNGYPDLPAQGRLPKSVTDAYNAAMDDQEESDESS